jgi:hypothetical protein
VVSAIVGYENLIEIAGAGALHGYWEEWAILVAPAGSAASLVGASRGAAIFVPHVGGDYTLLYTAGNFRGDLQRCEVEALAKRGPVVSCATEPVRARAGAPIVLEAAIESVGPVSVAWRVTSAPLGANASVVAGERPEEATFEADVPGEFHVQVEVSSAEGSSTCDLVVIVEDDNRLRAICPPTVEVAPLETVDVEGDARGGEAPRFEWVQVSVPAGSAVVVPDTSSRGVELVPDIVGDYVLELRVEDAAGAQDTCRTTVRAVTQEGLRIEMFWLEDTMDIDLHLLHPDGTRWFHPIWDCYWSSCRAGMLDWFTAGPSDDPHLDIDDLEGFGPENINIDVPPDGVYRVGVHAYSGLVSIDPDFHGATAVVRVYCGVGSTTPIWESPPTSLVDPEAFWWVADVVVDRSGCSVDVLGRIGTRLESEHGR